MNYGYIRGTKSNALNTLHCMLQEAENGEPIDFDEAYRVIEEVRDDEPGVRAARIHRMIVSYASANLDDLNEALQLEGCDEITEKELIELIDR